MAGAAGVPPAPPTRPIGAAGTRPQPVSCRAFHFSQALLLAGVTAPPTNGHAPVSRSMVRYALIATPHSRGTCTLETAAATPACSDAATPETRARVRAAGARGTSGEASRSSRVPSIHSVTILMPCPLSALSVYVLCGCCQTMLCVVVYWFYYL